MAGRFLLISVNQCKHPYPVFPLGLSHLDAALRAAGYETRWVDLNLASLTSLAETLASFRPDAVGLSLRNIDDVLIRKREVFFEPLAALCRTIRERTACPVVLGGSGFSIFPRELIELSGADFGIQGEGEESLPALLRCLEQRTDFSTIPGLVFRRADGIAVNPQRAPANIVETGSVERPDELARFYLQRSTMLNVQTQRGCSFTCCYCTYPVIEGNRFRRRDPEVVAEEFARLAGQGARYVFIVDSVFNSSAEHVASVCEALLRRNLKIKWGCFLRPAGLSAELVALMARAGLAHIEFGSDSFCDEVLRDYGKRFTFGEVLASSEYAHRAGVDYCHFLICGGPGETRATLQQTYDNSLRLPDAVVLAVAGMRIYPGTPLFQLATTEGRLAPGANLLQPAYYMTQEMTEAEIFAMLEEFARRSPNWIVGDPPPTYLKLVERLRQKGVVGPLWGYFTWMQRLRSAAEGTGGRIT